MDVGDAWRTVTYYKSALDAARPRFVVQLMSRSVSYSDASTSSLQDIYASHAAFAAIRKDGSARNADNFLGET